MSEIQIFLSHKKGDFDRNAQRIAGDLALFGGKNVKIICSANFEPGIQWEQNIRKGLAKANWLILVYTGPHTDWGWCLFETGFFSALINDTEVPPRRLICLHDPVHSVPAPLRGFVAVPATKENIILLFQDIYLNDPWKISPMIFRDNIGAVNDAAARISKAATAGGGPQFNVQVAPLINIRIKKSEIDTLQEKGIPQDAPVTGEGTWETIFGKPEATAGWTWGDLTRGIDKISAWEYQLCAMMVEAAHRKSVQYPSIAIRISIKGQEASQGIYRIGLRRISGYENEDYEFVFVLSRVRTAFEPSDNAGETMVYHLFNLAWHFRRRFIEYHRNKMQEFAEEQESMVHAGRQGELNCEVAEAVNSISLDLKALEADAQVRGIDGKLSTLRKIFKEGDRQKFDHLMGVEWPPLYGQLQNSLKENPPKPRELHTILTKMDPINAWFCKSSTKLLDDLAQEKYSAARPQRVRTHTRVIPPSSNRNPLKKP
jgi:hypothetical protein